MPQEKRTGLSVSVTDDERNDIAELQDRMGGLSYAKMFIKLVRDELKRLRRMG